MENTPYSFDRPKSSPVTEIKQSFQGDLLTILSSQLATTHDTALRNNEVKIGAA